VKPDWNLFREVLPVISVTLFAVAYAAFWLGVLFGERGWARVSWPKRFVQPWRACKGACNCLCPAFGGIPHDPEARCIEWAHPSGRK
jgi:hypothetical protein